MKSGLIAITIFSKLWRRTQHNFDALTWITSYAGIRHAPGIPLYDYMQAGKRGDDPRMFFSWYGGDFTTDPAFADKSPEERANPSMAGWGNPDYLPQQRRRLPTHKYRRLHLNLPGAPDGAAFDGDAVMAAIISGQKRLSREDGRRYTGFVDMSGGSSDDAVIGVAHYDKDKCRVVLDLLECQTGHPPFSPRAAVKKFAGLLKEYGLSRVVGDAYAGLTFRQDFSDHGVTYEVSPLSKSEIYDEFEPKLNAGEIELLDIGKLQEQLLTLVIRGAKIDHQPGDHDDFANAAAGAIVNAHGKADWLKNITPEMVARASRPNSRADQFVQFSVRHVQRCAIAARQQPEFHGWHTLRFP